MQQYEIILESQLGQRYGTLVWQENAAGQITGIFSLMGIDNPISGQKDGQRLSFSHDLRTAVRVLNCHTVLTLCGDSLYGTVSSERSVMKISGKNPLNRFHWSNRKNSASNHWKEDLPCRKHPLPKTTLW